MSAELLTTIPGDIPGLLRRGSPAWGSPFTRDRRSCVIVALDADMATINYGENLVPVPTASLMLDLTDKYGRVDAAWWAYATRKQHPHLTMSYGEDAICMTALLGDDVTPAQIDTLARLVLRLAGRGA